MPTFKRSHGPAFRSAASGRSPRARPSGGGKRRGAAARAAPAEKVEDLGKQVKLDAVQSAIAILHNNALRKIEATRGFGNDAKDPLFDPAALKVARGLFSPEKTYMFDMQAGATLSSTAGGVLLASLSFSPAVSSFLEYAALSALFDEVKLRSTSLVLITASPNSAGTNIQVPIVVAVDQTNISTAPASFNQVLRIAGSDVFSSNLMTGGSGRYERRDKVLPRVWASVITPATAGPPSGMLGSYQFAGFITATASQSYYSAFLLVKTMFRARA